MRSSWSTHFTIICRKMRLRSEKPRGLVAREGSTEAGADVSGRGVGCTNPLPFAEGSELQSASGIIQLRTILSPCESGSGVSGSRGTRRFSSKSCVAVVVWNSCTKVVTIFSHNSGVSLCTFFSSNCCRQDVPIRASVSFSVEN